MSPRVRLMSVMRRVDSPQPGADITSITSYTEAVITGLIELPWLSFRLQCHCHEDKRPVAAGQGVLWLMCAIIWSGEYQLYQWSPDLAYHYSHYLHSSSQTSLVMDDNLSNLSHRIFIILLTVHTEENHFYVCFIWLWLCFKSCKQQDSFVT